MNRINKAKRKASAMRWLPIVALCSGIAALALFFLHPRPIETPDSPQQTAERTTTPTTTTATTTTAAAGTAVEATKNTSATETTAGATRRDKAAAQESRQQQLARLIDQRFTPAMKQQINQLLAPAGRLYPEQPALRGGMVDLSGRASSVTIAVLDDDGELLVADITSPLTEQSADGAEGAP